jgi:hypothetical protein
MFVHVRQGLQVHIVLVGVVTVLIDYRLLFAQQMALVFTHQYACVKQGLQEHIVLVGVVVELID